MCRQWKLTHYIQWIFIFDSHPGGHLEYLNSPSFYENLWNCRICRSFWYSITYIYYLKYSFKQNWSTSSTISFEFQKFAVWFNISHDLTPNILAPRSRILEDFSVVVRDISYNMKTQKLLLCQLFPLLAFLATGSLD